MAILLKTSLVALTVFSSSLVSAAEAAKSGCKLASPLPPHCSIQGNVKDSRKHSYKVLLPQRVNSVEDCALLCSRRIVGKELNQQNFFQKNPRKCFEKFDCNYCQSFEFNTNTGICQLSFDTVDRYVKPNSESSLIFNEKDCYVCPPTGCDAPFGTNLLDNADFEGDFLGPWRMRHGNHGKGQNSTKGFNCDVITAPDKGNRGCQLEQSFNACPNSNYMLTFDYKTPTQGTPKKIKSEYGDDGSPGGLVDFVLHEVPFEMRSAPTNWKKHTQFFVSPNRSASFFSGNVVDIQAGFIHFQKNNFTSQGAYKFDNFQVIRVPSEFPIKQGALSMVKNGGFKTGVVSPWVLKNQTGNEIVSPGIHSKFGLQTHASAMFFQNTLTAAGVPYLLKFDFAPGPNTLSSVEVSLHGDSHKFNFLVTFSGDKRTIQVPLVPDLSENLVTFYIENTSIKGLNPPGTSIIDNISLKEIDMEALLAGGQ